MTVENFKAWYDAVYIGDGEVIQETPKSIDDPKYSEYMSGYTLAYGAYLEGAKSAEEMKYQTLVDQVAKINEMLAVLKEVRSDASCYLEEMRPSLLQKIDSAIAKI